MTATLNGRPPRKQLGDQLDRLDGILDALPGAVADGRQEGARQAMKEVVLELLTNPDVRALLTASVPVPAPANPAVAKPTWWQTLKAKVTERKDAALDRATAAVQAVTLTARMLTAVLALKRIALVKLGVGLAAGLTALLAHRFCPPAVAAAVSGVGAAVTAAVGQVTPGLRKGGCPPADIGGVGSEKRPAGRAPERCASPRGRGHDPLRLLLPLPETCPCRSPSCSTSGTSRSVSPP